jgi:AraC-like DNA-binding protein
MPLYEPTIPFRYVEPLIQILREREPGGIRQMLKVAGLDEHEGMPADSSLPMLRFDRLLTEASARLQRTDLGFELGQRITLKSHSALGQAAQRCSTLQELLMLLERYYHMVTPTFAVRYVPGPSHCEWRIRVAAPMSQETLRMCLEMHAVSVHTDLLRMFGSDTNIDIYLSLSSPSHVARYERLPRTRFHFSSGSLPEVRTVIPAELARRRLRPPDNRDTPGADDFRASSASGLQPAESYGDWVTLMLREAQMVQPTVTQLAALLNMSARTLARRLSSEGINFRDLSTRVRHERACVMLCDHGIPMHQIAFQLGYGDTTAFIRAFCRASGSRPAHYRDSHLRDGAR